MKRRRLFPSLFKSIWIIIVPLLVIVFALFFYLGYRTSDTSAYYAMLPILLLVVILIGYNRKEYFSKYILDESGVAVSLWGKVWFRAGWDELQYIGEFKLFTATLLDAIGLFEGSIDIILLSKVSAKIDKKSIRHGLPSNSSLKGKGVFIQNLPETKKEILHRAKNPVITNYPDYNVFGKPDR